VVGLTEQPSLVPEKNENKVENSHNSSMSIEASEQVK
jgi:hypothetical protein